MASETENRIVTIDEGPDAALAAPPVARWRWAGRILVRLALDLLVVDAVIETWMQGSPLRTAIAGVALLYWLLTAYVLSKGGRIGGRGWLMDPFVPGIVVLLFLVAATWTAASADRGVFLLQQGTPVVLAGTMLVLIVLEAVRMVAPGGARSWWVRIPIVVVSGYAVAAFGAAMRAHAPFVPLLNGHGYWPGLPWWLQGTWIGPFLLLPLACLRELGASIARLTTFPYFRWMVVFGLGCWIAFNIASF